MRGTPLNNKWDFLSGGAGIEVKATTGDRRRHQFKLEQFEDPDGLLLASVMLRAVYAMAFRSPNCLMIF